MKPTSAPKNTAPNGLMADPHFRDTLKRIQEIIAEMANDEPENINPKDDLETDLGFDLGVTFPLLVANINEHFGIRLVTKMVIEEMEDEDIPLNVQNLALKVSDETKWG